MTKFSNVLEIEIIRESTGRYSVIYVEVETDLPFEKMDLGQNTLSKIIGHDNYNNLIFDNEILHIIDYRPYYTDSIKKIISIINNSQMSTLYYDTLMVLNEQYGDSITRSDLLQTTIKLVNVTLNFAQITFRNESQTESLTDITNKLLGQGLDIKKVKPKNNIPVINEGEKKEYKFYDSYGNHDLCMDELKFLGTIMAVDMETAFILGREKFSDAICLEMLISE